MHLVCIFIASQLPTFGRTPRRRNLLSRRDSRVREAKACFLVFTFWIAHALQPSHISITNMESGCPDLEDIVVTHLHGPGECNNTTQISFRAICSLEDIYTLRAVFKGVAYNY